MRRRDGCTLLELLLSLFFSALLAAMVFPLLQMQKRLWERQETVREECRTLTSALRWMTRDLREAGYHTASRPLESVESQNIVYHLSRDTGNPEAFSAANRRRVTVSLKGGDLMYRVQSWDEELSRWRRGSTQKLASSLAGLEFLPLNARGEAAVSPDGAAALRITLTGRRTGAVGTLVAFRNHGGLP